MGRGVHGFANSCEIAGDPGRGFRLNHQHGFDLPVLIAAQPFLDSLRRRAGAVLDFQALDVDAVGGRGPAKQVAEMAVDAAEDLFTGRKRVDDATFPGPGA